MKKLFNISYKAPKLRKLIYLEILADNVADAIKQAPKSISHNIGSYNTEKRREYYLYGVH